MMESRSRLTVPRLIALLLALGGMYWGALLLPLIFRAENLLLPLVVFGPGYIVTAAYVLRAATTPALAGRQCIWILSILVQGGWLAYFGISGMTGAGGMSAQTYPVYCWWGAAFVGSIVALVMEKTE